MDVDSNILSSSLIVVGYDASSNEHLKQTRCKNLYPHTLLLQHLFSRNSRDGRSCSVKLCPFKRRDATSSCRNSSSLLNGAVKMRTNESKSGVKGCSLDFVKRKRPELHVCVCRDLAVLMGYIEHLHLHIYQLK